jgi:hypothetical protein
MSSNNEIENDLEDLRTMLKEAQDNPLAKERQKQLKEFIAFQKMSKTINNPEEVSAIGCKREYSVDSIHSQTSDGFEIFVPKPYGFIACFGKSSVMGGDEMFLKRSEEPSKTESPTFRRQDEPLVHKPMKVDKKWADICLKTLDLKDEMDTLKKQATDIVPVNVKGLRYSFDQS